MKVNIGCGNHIKPEYINMDLYPINKSITKGDIRDLPFNDGELQEIYASDVLEHISHNETLSTLKHWFHKLSPGGKLFIRSPCLKALCEHTLTKIADGNIQEIEIAIRKIFGGQKHPGRIHYTAINEIVMSKLLKQAGFTTKPKYETNFGNGTNIKIVILKQSN